MTIKAFIEKKSDKTEKYKGQVCISHKPTFQK